MHNKNKENLKKDTTVYKIWLFIYQHIILFIYKNILLFAYQNSLLKLQGFILNLQVSKVKQNREKNIISKNDKSLLELKDSQKGKSCIIIGNGPSLQVEDLEKIYKSNILSFGLNQINQIYKKTVWRPDYFVVHDYGVLSKFSNQSEVDNYIKEIQDEKTKNVFLNSETPKSLKSIINKKILFFRIPIQKINTKHLPPISSDISLKIEDYGTVTNSAIQIALYMGIKTIYLIGQDFTYKEYIDVNGNYILDKDAKDYVKGLKGSTNFSKYNCPDLRTAFRGFKKIKEYADEHGVEIVNVTRGGNLDIFERASFDDIFDNLSNT